MGILRCCAITGVVTAVIAAAALAWISSLAGTPHGLDHSSIGLLTVAGIVEGPHSRSLVNPQLRQLATNRTLVGKKVFVTGGNRGLGRGIATHLAAMGADVVIASRRTDASITEAIVADARKSPLRKLSGTDDTTPQVGIVQLDLSSLSSVMQCAESLLEAHGTPDIIITNAAVVPAQDATTADGFELMFQVNYLGHYALLRALLSADAVPARLVLVASEAHRSAAPLFENQLGAHVTYDATTSMVQYAHTKLALVTLGQQLARQLAPGSAEEQVEIKTFEAPDGSEQATTPHAEEDIVPAPTEEDEAVEAAAQAAEAAAGLFVAGAGVDGTGASKAGTVVASICPGPVNSDIARHSPALIKPLVSAMMGALFASSADAAEAVVLLAGRPGVAPGSHWHMGFESPVRPDAASPELGRRLLEESDELLARANL